ncbi:Crp/Fnr family transcriptional regulator [Flavihumibacter solisilvae]|uniref:Crp/Fnr family transcriptional regulator n=1 Tax=Flavihumibacter solisilvae TaxID=1349421 RepID=UPI00068F8CC1|nr:Crp/Fnr family transcriptional regulator [Flavihumibacter solisilvae]
MEISHTPEALTRFRQKLESIAPLSDSDFTLWANTMLEKHLAKGEVLLKEGQVCRQFFFIFKGSIRTFSLENGIEVNVHFYFEDDFVCDFDSFQKETPSKFYFVCMENTTVYAALKTEAVPIFQTSTTFYNFLFRFFQRLYLEESEHSNSFKLMSPDDRYHYLIEHKPQLLQRIPLTHLASYLGISRETLTRIRKKTN